MLLRLLRAHSPCSKADLVRYSGLSATTVSVATAQLAGMGLVQDLGEGESNGGRPPGLLHFNARHGFVAAADIGGTRLRMMLTDANGRPLAQWATHLRERQKTPRAVISLLQTGLQEMMKRSGVSTRIRHLCIGAPGITDVDRGVVLAAPNLQGWTDLPLREMVERELRVHCSVDNDTNLAALGERAEGVARGMDDFIFIAVGTGVGAGIFVRGALLRGSSWSAGEVGYLPVNGAPREAVRMEETGQLERVIGGAGVEASWQKILRRERRSAHQSLMPLRASQIFDLAEDGHGLALEVLTEAARILADTVTTISLLLNPQMVVLGGGIGSHRALCRATEAQLEKNQFARPALRSSSLGTEAQLYGAIAVALSAMDAELLC